MQQPRRLLRYGFNQNVTISGSLIASNILTDGATINSNVVINNQTGIGPALFVSQKGTGNTFSIAEFFDADVSTTTPVFKIAEGGNIGIGTDVPLQELHLYSSNVTNNRFASTGALFQNATAGDIGILFQTSNMGDNTWGLGVHSNQTQFSISYGTKGATYADTDSKLVVLSTGEVGIGTTTPSASLHVIGQEIVQNTGASALTATSAASAYPLLMRAPSDSQDMRTGIAFVQSTGSITSVTPGAAIGFRRTNDASYGQMEFQLKSDPASGAPMTSVLTLLPNRNVGVGTTTPLYRLHVAGGLYADGYSNLPVASASGAGIVELNNNLNSTSTSQAATASAVKRTYDVAADALSRTSGGTVSSNVTIMGTLTASNLIVLGDVTTLDTYVSQTSNVSVINAQGTGPALYVSQTGIGLQYSIAEFYDTDVSATIPVFKIAEGGNIGIGTTNPTHKLHIVSSSTTDNDYESAGILLENSTFNEVGIALKTAAMGTSNWVIGINSNQSRLDIGYGPANLQINDAAADVSILANGNVGIGSTTPGSKLDVTGAVRATQFIGDGSLLTGVATGPSSQWTTQGSNIVIIGSNVGIGTTIPDTTLRVQGTVKATQFIGDGSLLTGVQGIGGSSGSSSQWTTTATSNVVIVGSNVGIGTTIADSALRVQGTVKATQFIGDGSLLTGVSTGPSSQWTTTSASNVVIVGSNVGIGTTIPDTALRVQGTVKATFFVGDGSLLTNLPSSGGGGGGESVWSSTTTTAYLTNKYVGIGTATPQRTLHVQGDTLMNGNLYLNGGVVPTSTLHNTYKNRLQITPSRYVYQVTSAQSVFSGTIDGLYAVYSNNVEVHQNGYKLAYLSPTVKDYDVTYSNVSSNTLFSVTLEEAASYGDVIDLLVWPNFLEEANTSNLFSTVYQKIYFPGATPFDPEDIVYPTASTFAAGIVQLSASTNDTSQLTAATPSAVKSAYDLAAGALSRVTGGIVQNDVVVQGTITTSNLLVLGDVTTVDTYVSQTSNVTIVNTLGTGPALRVSQSGIGFQYSIAEFFDSDVSTSTPAFKIAEGGNVGVGTTNPIRTFHVQGRSYYSSNIDVNGDITAAGDIIAFSDVSDRRLKDNIRPLENVTAELRAMNPVRFRWSDDTFVEKKKGTEDIGLIAQEVQELFPHVACSIHLPHITDTTYVGIHYEKLVPILIKGIQELMVKNDKHEARIAALEEELSTIRK